MNNDVLKEGLEAIPRWIAFLDDRLLDVDAEAAQIQAKGTPPPPTPLSALFGGRGAIPVATPHEEASALTPLPVAPESAPADTPTTGATAEGAYQFVEGETTVAAATPTALTEEATPHIPAPSETETPPVAPTSASEARAQFEGAWQRSAPELPKVVRDAYTRRAEAPVEFAQVMLGARASGYLSPDLDRAVRDLMGFDTYFQNAEVMFHDPQFADLFAVRLQDEDYTSEESGSGEEIPQPDGSTNQGEADRAVEQGDDPF